MGNGRRRLTIILPVVWILLATVHTTGCHRENHPGTGRLDSPLLAGQDGFGNPDGVPVICYHYFRRNLDPGYLARVTGSLLFGLPALGDKEFWTLPAGEFEKHLRFFREHDITVMTLDEVNELNLSGRPLPDRAVVLTIDDAEASTYTIAYPLLHKYGLRAHLFVPTAEVGRPWSGLKMCTWDQLAEMEASGTVILESHTNREHFKIRTPAGYEPVFWHPEDIPQEIILANLRDMNSLGREISGLGDGQWDKARGGRFGPVTDDLLISRARLLASAGADARWLAWPYGYGNGDLDSVAAAVGFTGTVSLMPRTFGPQQGPWHVGRYVVTAKTTLDQIAALFPELADLPVTLADNAHP